MFLRRKLPQPWWCTRKDLLDMVFLFKLCIFHFMDKNWKLFKPTCMRMQIIIYDLDKFIWHDSGVSEDLKAYIIELPYEGEAISMFILLPPFTPNALQETISRLNASTIREAMDGMYPDSIEIFLPRFKIQQTMDLSQVWNHTFQSTTNFCGL